MTKKDYELIAGTLKVNREWTRLDSDLYHIICDNFANALNRHDPRFNRDKFLTLCGIETHEVVQPFKGYTAEVTKAGTHYSAPKD